MDCQAHPGRPKAAYALGYLDIFLHLGQGLRHGRTRFEGSTLHFINMKKLLLGFLPTCCLLGTALAQNVHEVSSKYEADIKVYVASNKYDADLLVYRVDSRYDADEAGRWFVCASKYEADKTIYFVGSKYDADLIIYYTDSKYEAKWRNSQKKQLFEDP